MDNECICELCFPNAKEICELLPNYWLFENEGKWGLMVQPGHKEDHVALWFPDKPVPDPDPDCLDNDNSWIDKICNWDEETKLRPTAGYHLINACLKAGYNWGNSGFVLLWLYDFTGKKLLEIEKRKI